jgi:hypothetical protein
MFFGIVSDEKVVKHDFGIGGYRTGSYFRGWQNPSSDLIGDAAMTSC